MDDMWDCIVVGGGAAGLSAALVLGRARRRTLVVDAGRQSNLAAAGIGGLLGSDGRPPADLYAAGRAELERYPSVALRRDEVLRGRRGEGGLELVLAGGDVVRARRVLLATGMEYRYPDVPGAAERWGGAVFHCPFCHGWEVRDRQLGVLDDGATGLHRALLLRAWSDDVVLLTNGPSRLDAADRERLEAAGVEVDERPVAALRGPGATLEAVAFVDGAERPCQGLLVPVRLHQRSPLAAELGALAAEPGMLAADAVVVDPMGATTAAGVFAAGDVSAQAPSVAGAVAAGSWAATMVVRDLMTAQVVTAHGATVDGDGTRVDAARNVRS